MGRGRRTSLSRRFAFVSNPATRHFSPPRSSRHTMSSLKLHPSLPAPVVHAGASLQAKSSVLTGVQDAYWSDEEVRRLFFLRLHLCPNQFVPSHHISPFCRRRRNALCVSRRWISLTSTSNLASVNIRYLTPFFPLCLLLSIF